jgi:hypothetical protein
VGPGRRGQSALEGVPQQSQRPFLRYAEQGSQRGSTVAKKKLVSYKSRNRQERKTGLGVSFGSDDLEQDKIRCW